MIPTLIITGIALKLLGNALIRAAIRLQPRYPEFDAVAEWHARQDLEWARVGCQMLGGMDR